MAITRFNAKNGLSVGTGSLGVVDSTGNIEAQSLGVTGSITPASSGIYDIGSPTRVWRNLYVANISGSLTGSGLEQNSIVFAGAGGVLTGSLNQFSYNPATGNVAIGKNVAMYRLDVGGSINATSDIYTNGTFWGSNASITNTLTANALSGSLTKLNDGSSYLIAGSNVSITSGSNGSVTIATSGLIGGSGTTNYVPKFTGTTTLGNSQIYDDGTNVGIGALPTTYKLEVRGGAFISGSQGLAITTSEDPVTYSTNNGGQTLFSMRTVSNATGYLAGQSFGSVIGYTRSSNSYKYSYQIAVDGNGVLRYRSALDANNWNPWALTVEGGTGNVGIGTTTVTARLLVAGSSTASTPTMIVREGVVSPTDGVAVLNVQNSAGTSILFVSGSGAVGVGVTVPNAALEVNRAITFSTIDTFGQFVVKSASGTTGHLLNFGSDATNGLSFIQSVNRGTNATPLVLQRYGGNVGIGTSNVQAYSGYTVLDIDNATNGGLLNLKKAGTTVGYVNAVSGLQVLATSGNDMYLTVAGSNGMFFRTNAVDRMTINSAGTVAPGADNTYDFGSPALRWRNVFATSISGSLTGSNVLANQVVVAGTGGVLSGSYNLFWDNSTNRLGIGTSSPGYALDVSGDINIASAKKLYIGGINVINTNATGGNDVWINSRVLANLGNTNDGMYIGYGNTGTTGGHLRFYANNTAERMRIYADTGNVAITDLPGSVASTTARLLVSGSTTGTSPTLLVRHGIANGSNLPVVNVQDAAGTSLLFVSGSGNIGIGTTDNLLGRVHLNAGNLYMDGTAGAFSTAAYNSSVYSRIVFDNDYSDAARGPNRITLHDVGNWMAGFGIHAGTMAYYSGDAHAWYRMTSTTPSLRMTLDSSGVLTPGSNNTQDIGTSGTRWRDIYARSGSFTGDISITGNLTVLGTQTIVNSTVVDIGDNIITLNSVASPQRYGGLYVNDTTANTTGSLLWDSDNNYWIAGLRGSEVALPTGSGNANTVPLWTGPSTLSNSIITQSSTLITVGGSQRVNTILSVGGATTGYGILQVVSDDAQTAPRALSIRGSTDGNKNLWLGYNTTGNYGSVQAFFDGTSASPLTLNPSGGNVGVGITNPGSRLHVSGETKIGFTNTGFRFFETGDDAYLDFVKASNNTVTARFEWNGYTSQSVHKLDYFGIYLNDSGGSLLSRLHITEAGNIGISTTVPLGRFHITGSSTGTSPTLLVQHGIANGSNLPVMNIQDSAGNSLLFVSGSGNVGVGISTPNYRLHVEGASTNGSLEILRLSNPNGGGSVAAELGFRVGTPDLQRAYVSAGYGPADYNLTLGTTIAGIKTETIRLTQGNVGIGTTLIDSKLVVNGNSVFSGSVNPDTDNVRDLGSSSKRWRNLYVANISGSLTGSGLEQNSVVFAGSGGVLSGSLNQFSYNPSTGNVAIGTNVAMYRLDVGGDIKASGMFYGGSASITNTLTANALSGSLTKLSNGSSYLVAGANVSITSGSNGSVTIATSGLIGGSGTTNYIPKFTGASTLANSNIFDDGSNIGIGTSIPGSQLDVRSVAGGYKVQIGHDSPSFGVAIQAAASAWARYYSFQDSTNNILGSFGGYGGSNTLTYMFIGAAYNNTALRADPGTGNVSVGNVSGTSRFYVLGSSTASTPTMIVKEGVASPTGGVGLLDVQNSSGTSLFFVSGSGNVGVGVANPSSRLHVLAGSAFSAQFAASTGAIYTAYLRSTSTVVGYIGDASSLVVGGSNADFSIRTESGNNIVFAVGTSEKVRIDSLGNVGIGTNSTNGNRLAISGGNLSVTGSVLPGITNTYDLGSVTYNWRDLYARSGSFSGDLTVTGNLTVAGTQTIVNSDVVNVKDNAILLNAGPSPLSTGGIYVADTVANVTGSLIWDTATDQWKAGRLGSETTLVSGSGTDSYIAKWVGSNGLGNSVIYDNGTNVGINTTTVASYRLNINAGNQNPLHMYTDNGTATSVRMSQTGQETWTLSIPASTSDFSIASAAGAITRFTTTGNVGIGTNTVTARLLVSGSSTATTPTMIVREGVVNALGGAGIFDVQTSTGTSLLFVTGSGNVGVGTITPAQRLHVVGRARIQTNEGGSAVLEFTPSTGNTGFLYRNAANSLRYDSTAGVNRLNIDTSGHMTPGSDDSQDIGSATLRWRNVYANSISGTLTGSNVSAGQVVIAGTGGVLSGSNDFFWDNTNRRIGIGTSTSLTERLHVNGNIHTNGLVNTAGTIGITPASNSNISLNTSGTGATIIGGLYFTTAQSIAVTLGTDSWVRLATMPNLCDFKLHVRINSTNTEESINISIKGNYYNVNTKIDVDRATYAERLREVYVDQPTVNGGPKIIYIRIRSSSTSPTVTWWLYDSTTAITTIHNDDMTATPPTSGISVILSTSVNTQQLTNANLIVSGSSSNPSIGIGTNNPSARLHVNAQSGTEIARFSQTAATGYIGFAYNLTTDSGYIGNGSSILTGAGNTDFVIRSQGALLLASNGNTRAVTINTSQNVGIGTGSPLSRLQVVGVGTTADTSDYGILTVEDNSANPNGLSFGYNSTAQRNFILSRRFGIGSLTLAINETAFIKGYNAGVGIGVTNPSSTLQISGSSTPTTPTMIVREGVVSPTDGAAILNVQNSSGTSVLVVSGSNRVGIGTNVLGSTLDISGLQTNTGANSADNSSGTLRLNFAGQPTPGFGASIIFSQQWFAGTPNSFVATGQIAGLKTAPAGSYGGGLAFFYGLNSSAALAEGMRINGSGNIGIGTTLIDSRLVVNGNSVFSGSVNPDGDLTRDLGSTTKRWRNLYVANISGSLTGSGLEQNSVVFAGSGGVLTGSLDRFSYNPTTGNVAIGTNTAMYRLDVGGDIKASGTLYGGSASITNTLTANALSGSLTKLNDGSSYLIAGTNISITSASNGSVTIATANLMGGSGTTNYVAKFTGTNTIGNSTIFDNGTSVGIGTATPQTILHINGPRPNLRLQNTTGATSNWEIFAGDATAGDTRFGIRDVGAATSRIVINAGGGVGIGTTNPTAILHASDSDGLGTVRFQLANTNAQGGPLRIGYFPDSAGFHLTSNGNPAHTNNPSNSVTRDYTNRATFELLNILGSSLAGTYLDFRYALSSTFSPVMRIQGDGSVGIGTTTLSARLHVSGSSTSAEQTSLIRAGVPNQLGPVFEVEDHTGTTLLVVSGSGVVGIGATGSFGTNCRLNVQLAGTARSNYTAPTNAGFLLDCGTSANGAISMVGGGALGYYFTNSTAAYDAGMEISSRVLTFRVGNASRVSIDTSGNTTPAVDNTQNLGSSTARWANVHATSVISSASLAPAYTTATSTIGDTAIFDTISVATDGAVYELMIVGNPNSNGSLNYRDIIYGKVIIGTGYDGAVRTFIQFIAESPPPRSLYTSGGGPLVADVVFFQGGSELTKISVGTTATIRVKISGYYSGVGGIYVGVNTTVRLKQLA